MAEKHEEDSDPESPTLLQQVLTYKSKTRKLFSPSITNSDTSSSYHSCSPSEYSSSQGSWDLDDLIKAAERISSSSSEASAILRSLQNSDDEGETDEVNNENEDIPKEYKKIIVLRQEEFVMQVGGDSSVGRVSE